jgi:hypothetical protein
MGFGHFVLALRALIRALMAMTVHFSFRAIKGLSIFDSSNAKSCASSAGVHGRPLGRGPSFIAASTSVIINLLQRDPDRENQRGEDADEHARILRPAPALAESNKKTASFFREAGSTQ